MVRLSVTQHLPSLLLRQVANRVIEHFFAKLKVVVKNLRPETIDNLIRTFCEAVKAVTARNVLNTFEHCGYTFEQ